MNEFLVLLEIVDTAGWIFLLASLTVALGLLVFDRQPSTSQMVETELSEERMAA